METFQRFEKKYLLNEEQFQQLNEMIRPYVEPDKYYQTDIRSVYYDTKTFQLIRRSLEKPEYKEKLRVRSYGDAKEEDRVFVELKKKFDGIVYKRRTKGNCEEVMKDIRHSDLKDPQVAKEIQYVLDLYPDLHPMVYIGCDRTSYVGKEDEHLRITFDRNISYRMKDLSLHSSKKDKVLTDDTVMELKIADAMPLWLSRILDEVKAYPRGFSKVGTAFLKEVEGVRS